jgi:hypothetical protein
LPIILARPRYPAEATAARRILCIHIICNDDQGHRISPP